MDAFDSYHREYLAIQKSITTKLDQELPKLRGGEQSHLIAAVSIELALTPSRAIEERKAAVRRTYRDLDEADEIVRRSGSSSPHVVAR